jgi:hypothetical protein
MAEIQETEMVAEADLVVEAGSRTLLQEQAVAGFLVREEMEDLAESALPTEQAVEAVLAV